MLRDQKNKNLVKKNRAGRGFAANGVQDSSPVKGGGVKDTLKILIKEVIEEVSEQETWYDPVLKKKEQLYLRIGQNINSASRFGLDSEWQRETGKRYENGVSAYFLKRTGKGYEIVHPDNRRASYKLENYFSNMFLNVLHQPICEGQIYVVKGKLIEIPNVEMDPEIYTDYKEFLTYDTGSDGEPLLEPGTVSIVETITLEDFINKFYFSGGRSVRDLFLRESEKEYNSLCDDVLNVLNKNKKLTTEEISQKIKDLKLYGFGGFCADAAIQINHKIFNGDGEYIVAANKFLFEKENRIVGHVAVRYNDKLWDVEGETTEDKLESWGMVDENDPDYSEHPEWTTDAAYEAELLEMDEDELTRYFDICRPDSLKEVMNYLFEERKNFQLFKFKELKTYKERKAFIEEYGLERIGCGKERCTYALSDKKVIKLEKDGEEEQNKNEYYSYKNFGKEYTPKIYEVSDDFGWIVSERVKTWETEDTFENATGLNEIWLYEAVTFQMKNGTSPENLYKEYSEKQGWNIPDVNPTPLGMELIQKIGFLNLNGVDDVARWDHWGIADDRRIVCIDLGLNL